MPKVNAYKGGKKKSPNTFQRQRNGLLALVHIAKKDLGLEDDLYRKILARYGAASASALSISELEELVGYLERLGWKKKPKSVGPKRWKVQHSNQVEALRDRIRDEALQLDNGEKRLEGLVKAKCGVDKLEWCRDVGKLKQVLRILTLLRENDPGKEVPKV